MRIITLCFTQMFSNNYFTFCTGHFFSKPNDLKAASTIFESVFSCSHTSIVPVKTLLSFFRILYFAYSKNSYIKSTSIFYQHELTTTVLKPIVSTHPVMTNSHSLVIDTEKFSLAVMTWLEWSQYSSFFHFILYPF